MFYDFTLGGDDYSHEPRPRNFLESSDCKTKQGYFMKESSEVVHSLFGGNYQTRRHSCSTFRSISGGEDWLWQPYFRLWRTLWS